MHSENLIKKHMEMALSITCMPILILVSIVFVYLYAASPVAFFLYMSISVFTLILVLLSLPYIHNNITSLEIEDSSDIIGIIYAVLMVSLWWSLIVIYLAGVAIIWLLSELFNRYINSYNKVTEKAQLQDGNQKLNYLNGAEIDNNLTIEYKQKMGWD